MRTILNLIWLVLAGIGLAIAWLVAAVVLAITIIGLPLARVALRMARYTLWPFGRIVIPDPDRGRAVSGIANLVWVVFFGWWLALGHLFSGILLCITIIGIPLGVANFKLARLAIAPFGKAIVRPSTLRVVPADAVVVDHGHRDP